MGVDMRQSRGTIAVKRNRLELPPVLCGGYKPSDRREVLRIMRRQELAHEPPATITDLAAQGILSSERILKLLSNAGLVWARQRRAGYFLTAEGRRVADFLLGENAAGDSA